jgi:hypothetical protein
MIANENQFLTGVREVLADADLLCRQDSRHGLNEKRSDDSHVFRQADYLLALHGDHIIVEKPGLAPLIDIKLSHFKIAKYANRVMPGQARWTADGQHAVRLAYR